CGGRGAGERWRCLGLSLSEHGFSETEAAGRGPEMAGQRRPVDGRGDSGEIGRAGEHESLLERTPGAAVAASGSRNVASPAAVIGKTLMQQEQFLDVLDRDEAERRFRAALDLRPLEAEEVPLAELLGRVLAEDVVAPVDVPSFDRSNMDGFAVRAED